MPLKLAVHLTLNWATDDAVGDLERNPQLAQLLALLGPPGALAQPPSVSQETPPPIFSAAGVTVVQTNGAAASATEPITETGGRRGGRQAGPPTLPFDEFDELVRKEAKRLSISGTLPGYALWNEQRDKRLPTLQAVILRYKASGPADLAKILGYFPPLHTKTAATETNGQTSEQTE